MREIDLSSELILPRTRGQFRFRGSKLKFSNCPIREREKNRSIDVGQDFNEDGKMQRMVKL